MCLICIELIKHKMTYPEAEKAARELVVLSPEHLREQGSLEHTIELLEALEDLDLEKLGEILDDN